MQRKEAGPKRNYKQDFQKVVNELENRILIGAFQPKERLVEKNLSELFNVSRFWIRDALKILETKGLVELVPYKGAVVCDVGLKELDEIYIVRVELEKLATRLSLERIRPSDVKVLKRMAKRVEECFRERDFQEMLTTNTSFHDYIFSISENNTLQEIIYSLRARCHIVRHFAWSSEEFVRKSLQEHQEYIKAFQQRDRAKLEELAEKHIIRAKNLYKEKLVQGVSPAG